MVPSLSLRFFGIPHLPRQSQGGDASYDFRSGGVPCFIFSFSPDTHAADRIWLTGNRISNLLLEVPQDEGGMSLWALLPHIVQSLVDTLGILCYLLPGLGN